MRTFENLNISNVSTSTLSSSYNNNINNNVLSITNAPVTLNKSRWWQGRLALAIILGVNVFGWVHHGPALTIISLPVLLFLNEGFQQTDPDQEATRKCSLEGFAKGALLGPPLLALAEAVGGVILALMCFGKTSFESIVNTATTSVADQSSFSTRLFREASSQDPVGAAAFAFLSSLLVAGFCEEAFKMSVGAWQVLKFRAHKKTLNPIVVMAGVGLGLAYAESAVAVLAFDGTAAARIASERVLTAFPIHVFCAVWTAKRAGTSVSYIDALIPASVAHGIFDFGLIICLNFSTKLMSLGWSFTASATTAFMGIKS